MMAACCTLDIQSWHNITFSQAFMATSGTCTLQCAQHMDSDSGVRCRRRLHQTLQSMVMLCHLTSGETPAGGQCTHSPPPPTILPPLPNVPFRLLLYVSLRLTGGLITRSKWWLTKTVINARCIVTIVTITGPVVWQLVTVRGGRF